MRKSLRCVVLAFAVAGVCEMTVAAAQWVVAQDGSGSFRSIRGGIDAAAYGDVVYVSPGIYEEPVALKDGVRVVGAGASSTIIRYAYGFDEVVQAQGMSSGSLERVTVERLPTVVPGPAVRVTSATLSLVDCIISGGQGAGVEVSDATSSLTLRSVRVTANAGHGLVVDLGARALLEDCSVDGNAGSGLLVKDDAVAHVFGTTMASNGYCGIALEGSARLEAESSTVTLHSEWGILATGLARLVLTDVEVTDNDSGGVRIVDSTDAQLFRITVRGGGPGIEASDGARLVATRVRIAEVAGDGIALRDGASLVADGLEVIAADGHGILLDTTAESSVTRSTVANCGKDGVSVRCGEHSVRQTILASNDGAGVRVDTSGAYAASAELDYNNVWGNGTDYVGVLPAATDMAEPPQFVDLAQGDLALLPGSACLEGGAAWTTIGAGNSVASRSAISLDLVPEITDGWLGATWQSMVRFGTSPLSLEAATAECHWAGARGRLDLAASLFGTWGQRATLHFDGATPAPNADTGGGFSLAYGADATLGWSDSWARGWLAAAVRWASLEAGGRASFSWPIHAWTADLSLGLAGPVELRIGAGSAEASFRSLFATASAQADAAGGTMSLDGRLTLLPTLEASLVAQWTSPSLGWSAGVAAQPKEEAWELSASVRDRNVGVHGRAHIVGGAARDGDVSIEIGGGAMHLRAGLTLESDSLELRLGLGVSLDGLFRAPVNEPPVPTFATSPPDPEARKPVRFLSEGSRDPDGQLREIWWDFGDGTAAEGAAVDHVYAEPGTYEVTLTVSDDAGAVASLSNSLHVWPADTTPVAGFSAYPVSKNGVRLPRPLRDGDLVRLDALDSSDPDGDIVEYAWDVGADGTFDVISADALATVGPLEAGSHPVTLRVVDDTGRSDAVMRVVVVDKSEPPQARFVFMPPTPAVRDPVHFSDRSADTDGKVDSWEWDFGDGTTAHEQNPVHRYERVGRYDVTLRVTDDAGLAAATVQPLSVSSVPEIVDVGEVWAVLIGISDYAEVKDLHYADSDASALARWLLDAGVAPDHLRLLLDREGPQSDLDGLVAQRATLVHVREALGWLRRVARPEDLVFVHFSGHGFQGGDDDGDEKDGVDEFFVLWDTVNEAKEDTALRDDEFGAALDRIESQHVVVFFDGCYSGGLSRSLPSSARPLTQEQDLFSDFSVEGRLVFSASSESQDAFESDELKHGIFSYYVLEGLRGRADSTEDGRVTAWELFEYVAENVPERARLERNARQDPELLGEGEVRVLLAQAAGPPVPDFSYEPVVPFAGGRVSFADQSRGDRDLRARRWSFGDGATSEEKTPTHVYERGGDFSVVLRVTDAAGAQAETTQVLTVKPGGTVLVVDAQSERIVVSLGRENGVDIGDRFVVPGKEARDAPEAELEVVELIESGLSACQLAGGSLPAEGVEIRPAPSAE